MSIETVGYDVTRGHELIHVVAVLRDPVDAGRFPLRVLCGDLRQWTRATYDFESRKFVAPDDDRSVAPYETAAEALEAAAQVVGDWRPCPKCAQRAQKLADKTVSRV